MPYTQKGWEAFTKSTRENIYKKPQEGSSPGKLPEDEMSLLTNREFASSIKNTPGFKASEGSVQKSLENVSQANVDARKADVGSGGFGSARKSNPNLRTATNPIARMGGSNVQARMAASSTGVGRASYLQKLDQQKFRENLQASKDKQLDFRSKGFRQDVEQASADKPMSESPVIRDNVKQNIGAKDALAMNKNIKQAPVNNVLGVNLHKSMA